MKSKEAVFVKASERLPNIDAKYFVRYPSGARSFIWRDEIKPHAEWLDESPKEDGEEQEALVHEIREDMILGQTNKEIAYRYHITKKSNTND